MGDQYFLTVKCPKCSHVDSDVYYAPTCGFTVYQCRCGEEIDLELYSGISAAECSNAAEIEEALRDIVANLGEEEAGRDGDDEDYDLPEAVPA